MKREIENTQSESGGVELAAERERFEKTAGALADNLERLADAKVRIEINPAVAEKAKAIKDFLSRNKENAIALAVAAGNVAPLLFVGEMDLGTSRGDYVSFDARDKILAAVLAAPSTFLVQKYAQRAVNALERLIKKAPELFRAPKEIRGIAGP